MTELRTGWSTAIVAPYSYGPSLAQSRTAMGTRTRTLWDSTGLIT